MNKISVALFGEGLTEWFYLEAIRVAKHYPFNLRPSIPAHSDITNMLKKVRECISKGYNEVICLVDMDRLNTHPAEMTKYLNAKKQKAYQHVTFIETDPCTEYWFLLHFLKTIKEKDYQTYDSVVTELRKYIPNFEKTKKFFQQNDIFKLLNEQGNQKNAIELSRHLTILHHAGSNTSYSEMFKLFDILQDLATQSRR